MHLCPADKDGRILRIGESGNLRSRYRGGTGWMVEAALHGSGNSVFVAAAPIEEKIRKSAEAFLIFKYQPPFCQQNKLAAPYGAFGNRTRRRTPTRNGLASCLRRGDGKERTHQREANHTQRT